jgi:hypothetical protein
MGMKKKRTTGHEEKRFKTHRTRKILSLHRKQLQPKIEFPAIVEVSNQ